MSMNQVEGPTQDEILDENDAALLQVEDDDDQAPPPELEPEPDPADLEEQEPKPRGKRKAKGKKRTAKQLSDETVERQMRSREYNYPDWIKAVEVRIKGYNQPGIEFSMERLSPSYHPKTKDKTAGFLETRETGPYPLNEVADRWGGGVFQATISAPNPNNAIGAPLTYKKKFEIAGPPKVTPDALPQEEADARTEASKRSNEQAENTAVQGAFRMLDRVWSQQSGIDVEKVAKPYESTLAAQNESMQRELETMREYSDRRVEEARRKESEIRQELERIREEQRRKEDEMRDKLSEASKTSDMVLTSLLPSFNDNARTQVEQAMRTFEAREARIEQQHGQALQQNNRYWEGQIDNLRTAHAAEMARLESSYQNQITLLQSQLGTVVSERDQVRQQAEQLRQELIRIREDQIRQNDPMEQLSKMQTTFEAMQSVTGMAPGRGGGGLEDDENAPAWMKFGNNLLSQIGNVVEVAKQRQQQQQPQQQQQMHPAQLQQMQMAQLQQAQMQQAAQQQAFMTPEQIAAQEKGQAEAAAAAAKAKEEGGFKVSRSKLKEALEMLAATKASGTDAEIVAQSAGAHLPESVLKLISARPSDKLALALKAEGLLPAPLADEDGLAYLEKFLTATNKRVNL